MKKKAINLEYLKDSKWRIRGILEAIDNGTIEEYWEKKAQEKASALRSMKYQDLPTKQGYKNCNWCRRRIYIGDGNKDSHYKCKWIYIKDVRGKFHYIHAHCWGNLTLTVNQFGTKIQGAIDSGKKKV